MRVLSPDLLEWIAPGRAGAIAIVDESGAPRVGRAWAVRVLGERDVLEIYLQRAGAASILEALARPRRASLNVVEVTTYKSRAFKGRSELGAGGVDMAFLDESLAAQSRAFEAVGMGPGVAERMLAHGDAARAMVAIHLTVESVFDQSPKPGAGARL